MAEPQTDRDELSARAARVAADVTEAEQPQDRQRIAAAFTRAVSLGRARGRPRHAGGAAPDNVGPRGPARAARVRAGWPRR